MPSVLTVTINPAVDVSSHTAQVAPTHKLRCDRVLRHAGGGGINVARVLRRLGVAVRALAPVGGTTGQLLEELLEDEAVDFLPVPIAGHTRESFTVLEDSSAREFRFVLSGPTLDTAEWQACLTAVDAVSPKPDWLVVSGSLPPGVPTDFYARLAHYCRRSGVPMVVDTSGPALAAALEAGVYLVKPSAGEMRSLCGLPLATVTDLAAMARSWVVQGKAEVVVVSMGEAGALLVSATHALVADALAVELVSAVGAGDSFVAGMVAGWFRHADLTEAFRWGTACAGAAIQSDNVGTFSVADLATLLPKVVLHSLSL